MSRPSEVRIGAPLWVSKDVEGDRWCDEGGCQDDKESGVTMKGDEGR